MTPAPGDTVICKTTRSSFCEGGINLARECIPAAVVEDRKGARGWYCATHGREAIDRREKRRTFWEQTHKRCCMCGGKMRASGIVIILEGPDPLELEFCNEGCRRRWERTHPL